MDCRPSTKGEISRALGIRAGLVPGSLDRKILAWAIALSGKPGVKSGTILAIAKDLPDWPGQSQMQKNAEIAMETENLSASAVIAAFAGTEPRSVEGATLLARAYLDTGQRKKAIRRSLHFGGKVHLTERLRKRC